MGLPTATLSAGISLTITEPAPIVQFSPTIQVGLIQAPTPSSVPDPTVPRLATAVFEPSTTKSPILTW
jgi:hypothetical protein